MIGMLIIYWICLDYIIKFIGYNQRKKFMNGKHDKIKNGKNGKIKHNGDGGDILFIDNEYMEYHRDIVKICDCILIQHQYEFLLNRDMQLIEEYIGIPRHKSSYYKSNELNQYQYPFKNIISNKITHSLSSINYELYVSIRNDIAHASFNKQQRAKQYNYINNMIINKIGNMYIQNMNKSRNNVVSKSSIILADVQNFVRSNPNHHYIIKVNTFQLLI